MKDLLKLKEYQKRTMSKLADFLELAKIKGIECAFNETQEAAGYATEYAPLPGLENVPYVCLRLPTGGGKTLLSSHSVSIVSKSFLDKEFPCVIWLVPTDIIRKQTLEVLKNTRHPNREILENQFEGKVRVYDISDFALLRPQDMHEYVNIFVATFAAFRVNTTDGRKVYAHNEELESHFSGMLNEDYFEKNDNGTLKYSFANILAYLRPIAIIDEAHNHKSKLSVEVMQRLRPSAIIEFTATPDINSNVLYKVSASELKAEDMIKLPIRLAEHHSWEDAVTCAIQSRERLEELAEQEKSYIRPIALFQAESIDKDITVEIIYKYLIEQEEIPESQIAIATGSEKGLDGVNLFDPSCPIRYVITVQALKEGWDCSFAYVFCSIAKVQSSKDAEQLLGRVMRMPYAKRCMIEGLNRAYAHVSVSTWSEAVGKIRDNLIGMGFEDVEADTSIQCIMPEINDPIFFVEPENVIVYVNEKPNVEVLNFSLRSDVIMENVDDGGYRITFKTTDRKDLQELLEKAAEIFSSKSNQTALIQAVSVKKTLNRVLSPSEQGEVFEIPQLCLDFGDEGQNVADKETFLPSGWNILDYSHDLEGFQVVSEKHIYEIDLQGTKLKERAIGVQETMDFGTATYWTLPQLVSWMDKRVHQSDIPYDSMVEFIRRAISHLQDVKGVQLADLVRLRFILEKLLMEKIEQHRKSAYEKGIQMVLFETPQVAVISPEVVISFSEGYYPAKSYYKGRIQFNKHFYPSVGEMNSEEELCAQVIDMHPKVKTWIRNIECYPNLSFWLPTSSDKFYPDFLAKLEDGRILVVEYKGEYLASNKDTKEKDLVGQLWARSSNGQCIFLMTTKRDDKGFDLYRQINEVIK